MFQPKHPPFSPHTHARALASPVGCTCRGSPGSILSPHLRHRHPITAGLGYSVASSSHPRPSHSSQQPEGSGHKLSQAWPSSAHNPLTVFSELSSQGKSHSAHSGPQGPTQGPVPPPASLTSPPTTLPLTHCGPTTQIFSRFLTHAKYPPTSGPLHWLVPLPALFVLQICPWPLLSLCAEVMGAFLSTVLKIPVGTPCLLLLSTDFPHGTYHLFTCYVTPSFVSFPSAPTRTSGLRSD